MAGKKTSKKSHEQEIEYKDRQIRIWAPTQQSARTETAEDDTERLMVDIDGSQFEVSVEDGKYSSILLPHGSYTSPEALVKDVIDYVPAYKR